MQVVVVFQQHGGDGVFQENAVVAAYQAGVEELTGAHALDPCFEIAEEALVMSTQFMAAVPANLLKNPLTSLSGQREAIVATLDLLMQGF